MHPLRFGEITIVKGKRHRIEEKWRRKIPFPKGGGWHKEDSGNSPTAESEIVSALYNRRTKQTEMIRLSGPDADAFLKNQYGINTTKNTEPVRIVSYLNQWLLNLGRLGTLRRGKCFLTDVFAPSQSLERVKQTSQEQSGSNQPARFLHDRLQAFIKGRQTDAEGHKVQRLKL